MSLTLLPRLASGVEFEPIDFGGTLPGVLGGRDQRLNRLGNRWRMIVTLPAMSPIEADAWAVTLARGLRTGVRVPVPEPEAPPGPNDLLVAGSGQAGAALAVDNGVRGKLIRKGKWLSVLTGGSRYLYKVAEPLQLDASGAGTLQIEPLIRAVPADNSPVELAAPMIEGLIEPVRWAIDARRIAEGVTFTVAEAG